MERLTNKNYKTRASDSLNKLVEYANINPNDVSKYGVTDIRYMEIKLGQLEDIEEELGIDLITLIKALKNGIWLKEDSNIRFIAPYKLSLAIDKCCGNSYILLEKENKQWVEKRGIGEWVNQLTMTHTLARK